MLTECKTLSESTTRAALLELLSRHHVVVIRDAGLSICEQLELTRYFGSPMELPYITPHPDHPEVIAVKKTARERNTGVFGGDWHSDFSFLLHPPNGSILNAVTIPPFGGDTLWANQVVALESLDPELRDIVDRHDAIHSGKPYGVKHQPAADTQANSSIQISRSNPEADTETLHPCVIRDSLSGRRALWLNPIYTTRLSHLSESDSAAILQEIYRHAVRPEFCYRHRWREGDLVIWNNFTTLHYAVNDYDGFDRLLYRTTYRNI